MALRTCRALRAAAAPSSFVAPTAPSAPGRVARLTLSVGDVAASTEFYGDALGFRPASPPTATRAVLGDASLGGCQLALMHAVPAVSSLGTRSPSLPLARPHLTVAVSNLATACRQARRRGGSIGACRCAQGGPSAGRLSRALHTRAVCPYKWAPFERACVPTLPATVDAPADRGAGVTEATLLDPDGSLIRALHLFRRSPGVCLTLPVASRGDVGASRRVARSFCDAFGLRVVGADELAELHLPPRVAAEAARPLPGAGDVAAAGDANVGAVVLAYGPAHNSTCLVFAPADDCIGHGGAAVGDEEPPSALVVTLEVADIGAAYAALAAAGWAASPFHPGADAGMTFTALEPATGLVLQVKG